MSVFGTGSMIGGPMSGYLADKYGWHLSFWLQVSALDSQCNQILLLHCHRMGVKERQY